ncbi:sensor histidine kinase [Nocardia sp. NPDC058176]|uniref:sensor histidine kinase n=1 Tax=Nocardia sp. NPDC058176 TaxID=3346368 RepID=UPI0036DE5892
MDRRTQGDCALTAVVLAVELALAHMFAGERPLDLLGTVLLVGSALPLLARSRAPMLVLAAHLVIVFPYHALEYQHEAAFPAAMIALYTVALHGNRRRTGIVIALVVALGVIGMVVSPEVGENLPVQAFGTTGWIVLSCVAGEAVRLHRAYLAAMLDRAERAERSRDEEAERRVERERLRIARDLHDLLAHTITVIQVQAGVAGHLLAEGQADAGVLAAALDTIADACADARAELGATVGVLRAPGGDSRAPLPTLDQLPALADTVRAAGIEVSTVSTGQVRPLAPTVELVAYRIIGEALTNVVKHAGARSVRVELDHRAGALVVVVADDGHGSVGGTTGFGIIGMAERAAAIGGSLRTDSTSTGFVVTAVLPLTAVGDPAPSVAAAPAGAGSGTP